MKCPYRILTEKVVTLKQGVHSNEKNITETIDHTYYEECYGEPCPFWDKFEEHCSRVENERNI